LDDTDLQWNRRAETLTQMIELFGGGRFPYWLRQLVAEDLRIVEMLALTDGTLSGPTEKALRRLLTEVPDIPLARSSKMIDAISHSVALRNQPDLTSAAMKSALSEVIAGEASDAARAFLHSAAAAQWLERVSEWDLCNILIQDQSSNPEAVARAWRWLGDAPAALYRRQPSILPALCDSLVRCLRYRFSAGIEDALEQVLHRAASEAGTIARLEIAGKMLRLAFDNVKYPLGKIVALAFPDVYAIAIQENSPPSFLSALFSWYDWDKGKDLRVTLIDSFLRSTWRPGDLAVAARDANILRKVFKRLYRRAGGERYLRAMYDDLSSRSEPGVKSLRDNLAALLAIPNFYEEWD